MTDINKQIEARFIRCLNAQIKGYNSISGFPELSALKELDKKKIEEIRNSVITGNIQADELRQRCYDLSRLIESYDNGEFE